MLIALNIRLRRGRRLRLLLATIVLGLAVVAAHGAVAGQHMMPAAGGHTMTAAAAAMTEHDAIGAAADAGETLMAMCLAIAQTAALALGALALARALSALHLLGRATRWPAPPRLRTPFGALAHPARPPDLLVLQVCRR